MANIAVLETRARFGDLARSGAIARFTDVFNQAEQTYDGMAEVSKIFKVQKTSVSEIRDTGTAGLDLLKEIREGTSYPVDANLVTYETDYSIQKLGVEVEVTEEAIDDTEYGADLDRFKHMAISAMRTKAKYAMNILNAGFSLTTQVNGFTVHRYGDAVRLFSTAHPRKDGGTSQSNASGTGITLTETNLETARIALVQQLTDRGLPMEFLGRIALVVPDDLAKTATILAQSDLRPSTANNDINFYKGILVDTLVSKWLNATGSNGSTTRWFLIDQNFTQLKLYVKQEPQFFQDREPVTRSHIFGVSLRAAAGHSDWRGTWASAGDGVSYSN